MTDRPDLAALSAALAEARARRDVGEPNADCDAGEAWDALSEALNDAYRTGRLIEAVANEAMETLGRFDPPRKGCDHLWALDLHGIRAAGETAEDAAASREFALADCDFCILTGEE